MRDVPLGVDLPIELDLEQDLSLSRDRMDPSFRREDRAVPFRRDNPASGVIRLTLTEIPGEKERELRRGWTEVMTAYSKIAAKERELALRLNPDGDPFGALYAEGVAAARVAAWKEKAETAITAQARAICQWGVAGYPAGEIKMRGLPVEYESGEASWNGSKRTVASFRTLNLLERMGILIHAARIVLAFWEGEPLDAEVLWSEAERETTAKLSAKSASSPPPKEGAAAPPFPSGPGAPSESLPS